MSRVLRIELRRSAAAWGAVVLAVAGTAMLLAEPPGWLGGWMSVVTTQRTGLLVVWPFALAVGAWQARTRYLAGVDELAATTALPAWRRVLPITLALGIGAGLAYLLVAVVAVLRFAGGAAYHPAAVALIAAVGVVSLVAGTCVGLALGRLVPSAVTAPAAAVGGLALLIGAQAAAERQPWLTHALSPALPRTVFSIQDLDLLTISPQVSAAQAVWLGSLAITGTALFAACDRRARIAALLPAVVGAAVALVLVPRGVAAPGVSFDAVASRLVCAPGEPRVCVARAHEALLPEVTPLAREGLRRLSRLPGAPTAAVEHLTPWTTRTGQAPAGTVFLPTLNASGDLAQGRAALLWALATETVDPRHCAGPAGRSAAGWLLGTVPESTGDDAEDARTRALTTALDALPATEALRRVQAVRTAAAAGCGADLDRLLATGAPR